MDNPRAEKVAVVDEVRERLSQADGAIVTEYRGMTVAEMQALRGSLQAAGGDYKVFKNTLVRRAIDGTEHAELAGLLVGPTAIAFVAGDVAAAAKALRDFTRSTPNLVLKGGVIDGAVVDASGVAALADLPSRDVLLAMLAGVIAAPLRNFAGALKAVPQSLAFGLAALRDQLPAAAPAPAEEVDAAAPAATEEAPAPEVASDEAIAEEAPAAEAPAAETPAEESPAAEAPAEEPSAE